jgi:methyltransferase
MITRIFFTSVVFIIIGQRLFELQISKRNVSVLLVKGGKEFFSYHKFVIVLQVSWFISMLGEVWMLNRPFLFLLAIVSLLATLIGQGLRYLSMQALGLALDTSNHDAPRGSGYKIWNLPLSSASQLARGYS